MRTDLYQFAVVGGDLRQWYLADILASKGHGVLAYGLCKDEKIENVKYVSSVKELIQEAEVLVYPIPFLSPNRMSGAELKERKEMLSCLRKGQIFFAGCIPRTVMQQMESQKVRVFDLMEDHCLAVENSVATAEGMIAEAMIRSPKNLRGSRCLILGYGVCGRMLASYLKGIRCEVGVVDKSQTACACARADGMYVVETDRFLQEIALLADKTDITEEIVRFTSHVVQLKNTLADTNSIGRKVDFILQEMNREVNTIGSKAMDSNITEFVVQLKCELEKIREQVQNVE